MSFIIIALQGGLIMKVKLWYAKFMGVIFYNLKCFLFKNIIKKYFKKILFLMCITTI
jgi:hypothetical protein